MKLLKEKELQVSNVVANCCMNRERQAIGDNSYEKDIYINPYSFLMDRIENAEKVKWLDICCGRGRALIQLMKRFVEDQIEHQFEFWGVDLVGMFDSIPKQMTNLKLIESSLMEFKTHESFDLITCVHGIHYIGDKLGVIQKYTKYLKQDGLLTCNLDTNNIFDKNGHKLGKKINSVLRNQGLKYDTRKKILRCDGKKDINFPFTYLGADDTFGKNYTGQKTVSSYYEHIIDSKKL